MLQERGNSKVAYELGMMYEKGEDVGQNLELALKYYKLSSEPKSQQAIHRLTNTLRILGDVCPICLDPYDMRTNFCSTLCGHSFHLSCLATAMEHDGNCPICRQPLRYRIQEAQERIADDNHLQRI